MKLSDQQAIEQSMFVSSSSLGISNILASIPFMARANSHLQTPWWHGSQYDDN